MPIPIQCPGCGQRMKAKDGLAGRTVPCPKCHHELRIPERQLEDVAAALLLDGDPQAPSSAIAETEQPPPETSSAPKPTPLQPKKKPVPSVDSLPPLTSNESPFWLRHLHWLLMLALLPLAVTLLMKNSDSDILNRLDETIETAPPETQRKIFITMEDPNADLDDLLNTLPRQRLVGAALSRNTNWHWAFALAAGILFLGFFILLATGDVADYRHLLIVGGLTGTVGIAILLAVQALAEWSQGAWPVGRGILMIFLWVAKLIGLSYRVALNPENGFWVSFLGFTAGVGLCEEVCKAAPILWRYRRTPDDNWRGAFLWGLASGAGFGIAEGVMYSANYYNGITGSGIYLVRFLSCVALHALWTGSVAIAIQQRQHFLQQAEHWHDFIAPTLVYIAVPMVLHGLYDTLLKKEMPALALLVALASFGYLAFQISRLHDVDDKASTAEMLREYKRRRKAMAT